MEVYGSFSKNIYCDFIVTEITIRITLKHFARVHNGTIETIMVGMSQRK